MQEGTETQSLHVPVPGNIASKHRGQGENPIKSEPADGELLTATLPGQPSKGGSCTDLADKPRYSSYELFQSDLNNLSSIWGALVSKRSTDSAKLQHKL